MCGIDGFFMFNFYFILFGFILVFVIFYVVVVKKYLFDCICGFIMCIFKYVFFGDDKIEYFVVRFCKYGRICFDYGIFGY